MAEDVEERTVECTRFCNICETRLTRGKSRVGVQIWEATLMEMCLHGSWKGLGMSSVERKDELHSECFAQWRVPILFLKRNI